MADEALLSREALLAAVQARYKSQPFLSKYLDYFDRLQNRNLPIILSFRHFSDIVGLSASQLGAMCFATDRFYRTFEIPKRSGGMREISAPLPDLANLQRWIAATILKSLSTDLSAAVIAYMPGRSIIDHVQCHLASAQLLKLDLRDFFPSISTSRVCQLFVDAGYTVAVARTLAAICTVHGSLPQGAPSSPTISNLVLERFDQSLSSFCVAHGLRYTRYADDIVISGDHLGEVQEKVSLLASENGFELNYTKSKAYTRSDEPRFVTGLVIHNGRVRLPQASRRRIRAQTHYYIRLLDRIVSGEGRQQLPNLERMHVADSFDDILFPDRLLGRLQFWAWVESDAEYPKVAMAQLKKKLSSL